MSNDAYTTPPTQADPELLAEFNAGVQRARDVPPMHTGRVASIRNCVVCDEPGPYRTCKRCVARARRARDKETK